jgi:WD40 repeat protein
LHDDSAVTISADGSIRQWDSTSGQIFRSLPAHTLGLVSLSVAPDGSRALYNSVEGLTCLCDLTSGELVGRYESYAHVSEAGDPGECGLNLVESLVMKNCHHHSLVCISQPQRRNICVYGWLWQYHYPFRRSSQLWRAPSEAHKWK